MILLFLRAPSVIHAATSVGRCPMPMATVTGAGGDERNVEVVL